MNTIPQMVKAIKDALKRIEALEDAAKQAEKPVVVAAETPVRRGRPPKASEPEPAPEATAEI